ncbi:hypothetical protein D3C87_1990340 [compost metagenome]
MAISRNGNQAGKVPANDWQAARSRVTYVPRVRWGYAWALAFLLWVLILGGLYFALIHPVDAMERCQRSGHSFDTCAETLW